MKNKTFPVNIWSVFILVNIAFFITFGISFWSWGYYLSSIEDNGIGFLAGFIIFPLMFVLIDFIVTAVKAFQRKTTTRLSFRSLKIIIGLTIFYIFSLWFVNKIGLSSETKELISEPLGIVTGLVSAFSVVYLIYLNFKLLQSAGLAYNPNQSPRASISDSSRSKAGR